jgi:hypothetical protein
MNHDTDLRDADTETIDPDKRGFLKQAGVVGAVAITGTGVGITVAQDSARQIVLGGETSGWIGRAPSSIQGTTNPTLQLVTGQQYAIQWTNVDGLPHNVVIEDSDGNNLVRSEIISEQGATQTVTFTASEEMNEYYCEIHPTTMRGSISIGANNETTETPQIPEGGPYANESATNDSNPAPDLNTRWPPVKTWTVAIQNGQFVGQSDDIRGQTNPTLTVQAGETYAIEIVGTEQYDMQGQRPNIVVTQDGYPRADSRFVSGPNDSELVPFAVSDGPASYFASAYTDARGKIEVEGNVTTQSSTTTK